MPFQRINGAEMGSNGTTVTNGNSGSSTDTAWNPVLQNSGTIKFSNTVAAHGSLSYQFATAGTSGTPIVEWTFGTIDSPTLHIRFYAYFPTSVPTMILYQCYDAVPSLMGGLGVNASDKLIMMDNTGSTVLTSTTTIPADQWVRVEARVKKGTGSTGELAFRLYTNANSLTPAESNSIAATTGSSNISSMDLGMMTTSTNTTVYYDSIALRFDEYPDPINNISASWLTFAP